MNFRKIIAREWLVVFLLAMLGMVIEKSLVHVMNFMDKTSGEWHSSKTSIWVYPLLFITIGYISASSFGR